MRTIGGIGEQDPAGQEDGSKPPEEEEQPDAEPAAAHGLGEEGAPQPLEAQQVIVRVG